ncbi:MAG TPA: dTDP-glucose 4,6-dehydratase [Gammaproteobacteria bacterium]
MKRVLVTGGAGFIGANFVRYWLGQHPGDRLVNLDALTYAGNPENLTDIQDRPNYRFIHGDIGDRALVEQVFREEGIDTVVNFAAESHVDRSILGPDAFIRTNINGTFNLLEVARAVWGHDPAGRRFLHVSTDEVYGSLGPDDAPFTETTRYAPNSPYSASKAASDHLVRAYHHTYGLPTLTTNCSNNYGPYQFPEKLIPLVFLNALEGKPLPIYGDGRNIRDWLYVEDHCSGIEAVLLRGRLGEVYNIGGNNEWANIDIVNLICDRLDTLKPGARPYRELITFVKDRPGHDRRYAIDSSKMKSELGWAPAHRFETGIEATLNWYLGNLGWCDRVRSGAYRDYLKTQYGS